MRIEANAHFIRPSHLHELFQLEGASLQNQRARQRRVQPNRKFAEQEFCYDRKRPMFFVVIQTCG